MDQKITVYDVVYTKQSIGKRIEAYSNEHRVFRNEDAALQYAQELAEKIIAEKHDYEEVCYNECETGNIDIEAGFSITNSDCMWANVGVCIKKLELDLNSDVILIVTDADW